ncbi:hypothetical protein ABZ686_03510 [Streptomyces sp. NPDC006992]|uniref:hypothetical protein n=1 Tax=unclassified Streptomyces TaxID=2593676 RepID=UPI0034023BF3
MTTAMPTAAMAADKPHSRNGPETWDTSGHVSGWFEHKGDKLVAWDAVADGKSAVLAARRQHWSDHNIRYYCTPLWNAKGSGHLVKRTCDGKDPAYTPEGWYMFYFPCTGEYAGREMGDCGAMEGMGVT